jgi:2-polyprenyl-3-methyl-5-hydroxy-6-metoxy-1,4-benzoquinol methylase
VSELQEGAMKEYNTTNLNPQAAFERHVFHRDMFAHFLRWSHVLRRLERGLNVLDVCCGPGELLEVVYRNRFAAKEYCGIDIRDSVIGTNRRKWKDVPWARFEPCDIVKGPIPRPKDGDWDLICFFEGIEHIPHRYGEALMGNIAAVMGADTALLISTPIFNGQAAANHHVEGVRTEYTWEELHALLSKFMDMHPKAWKNWGTFASKDEILPLVSQNPELLKIYERLEQYYDSNLMAVLFAPLFPRFSRNSMWEMRKKKVFA